MGNKDKDILKTIEKIQDYSKNIQETFKKIVPKIPTLNIPQIKLPRIDKVQSSDIIKEKNNWERHAELINIQDAVLKIQGKILDEQRSTSKRTLIILIITVIALIISGLTLLKMIGLI